VVVGIGLHADGLEFEHRFCFDPMPILVLGLKTREVTIVKTVFLCDVSLAVIYFRSCRKLIKVASHRSHRRS